LNRFLELNYFRIWTFLNLSRFQIWTI
jgi:hypothetical protein